MSHCLNPALTERTLWPFAVGVQMPGEDQTTYLHFDSLGSASLYASLLDSPENNVTRWVANLSSHIVYSSRLGWSEVGTFDPALSHEVRSALCTSEHRD